MNERHHGRSTGMKREKGKVAQVGKGISAWNSETDGSAEKEEG